MNREYVIGIDTSNYCTSVAVIDKDGNIIFSQKQILDVKKGSKGLRQSEALFQHLNRLPGLIEEIMGKSQIRENIKAVAVSVAPRDVQGSYMPCFLSGKNIAKAIASVLGVPLVQTYHQNGHMEAALLKSRFRDKLQIIGFHFSGGTTEALLKKGDRLQIIGGTKDISFGQLIDRVGVKLGYDFPAGKFLDEILISNNIDKIENKIKELDLKKPTEVTVRDGYFNLSGIETHLYKIIDNLNNKDLDTQQRDNVVSKLLFDVIGQTICQLIKVLNKQDEESPMIFFGGVLESRYLRSKISEYCKQKRIDVDFAPNGLSGDNAVGVACIGREKIWRVNP